MGDEREFKIRITTSADASGAQKTAAELDNLGRAQDEAGKKAETHGGHLRAMHKVFHALNELVPGLGVLMQAAFSPIGAAVSGALIVLRLFHEKMKEVNEEFRKMEEEAARPATNRMAAWREATVQAAEGMNHLHQELSDTERGQETLKESTVKADAAFREQAQAANALADALKDNELARLEEMHAAGLMSEEQYARDRLQIELGFEKKKRELQENEAMREILMRRRTLEQAEMAQPGLTSAAEGAELRKVKALEDLGSLDKSGVEERRKGTTAALSAFEKKIAEGHGLTQGAPELLQQFAGIGPGKSLMEADRWMRAQATSASPYHTSGAERYMEWDTLKTAATGAEAEWKQFPRAEAQRKVAADKAAAEAEQALKAAVANQSFITETGRDIGERRSRFGAMHAGDMEIGALSSDSAARRGGEGSTLMAAGHAQAILEAGGRISVMQGGIERQALAMLNSAGMNGEATLHALATLDGNQRALHKKIDALAKQIRHQASPP